MVAKLCEIIAAPSHSPLKRPLASPSGAWRLSETGGKGLRRGWNAVADLELPAPNQSIPSAKPPLLLLLSACDVILLNTVTCDREWICFIDTADNRRVTGKRSEAARDRFR
nr:PREDICTED: uncharacterized protein LOC107398990 [Tribolium castaneum]|eukprot:XP_015840094.1 PREDICTED: uncharacterized protein LOC107398990 [Tribolium castaneum]